LLQRNVVWESSPLVKERIFVKDAKPDAKVLVYRPLQGRKASDYTFTRGEPLVAYRAHGSGKVLWVSMCTGYTFATFARFTTQGTGPYWNRTVIPGTIEYHSTEANKPFYLWPYFNYFLYQSSLFLANKMASEIDTYAMWPFSPIPHQPEAVAWMTFVAGLWVFNFVLFFTLGRKKGSSRAAAPATPGEKPIGEKPLATAEERKAAEEKTAEERKAAELLTKADKEKPSEGAKT
jgi:hypothetical protein